MGCKFKYKDKVYESEADLKAVLRQELKANTAKVRDGDKQTTQPTTNTTTQLSEYESERVRKYYTSVLQEYKNQVAYLESDTSVKLHELRTKILDENFDRWRNSDVNTYVSHNFELLEKIKSDPKINRKTVSEFEKLYSADLKIRQKNQALNSDNLDLFLSLPKNLKDQIRNSGINLDVPLGERASKKKYLEAISKIEDYLSSQQSTTTQQPVVDEITIQKMAEIMKEIYPEVDVVAVTNQSQFAKEGNNVFNQESSIVTYQDEDDDGNITNNTLKLSDVKLNVINNGVLGDRELTYQIIDSSTNKLLGRVRVNKKEGTNYYQIGNIALFPSIKISEEEYNSFMAQLIHRLSTIFRDAISGFRKRTLIGKGVGKQVYSELNKELQEYELISDDTRSHNAEMMWQSLERKGLAEKIQFKGDTIYKYKKNAGIPIKEGVQELFDSNPELANSVYEALGFKGNVNLESNLKNTGKTEQELIEYLKQKYPEIKLDISNNPIWEKGDNIFNQEEFDNQVKYRIRAIEILQSDKAKEIFEKGNKNKWGLDKILTELQVPKEQKQLILNIGKPDIEEIITDLLANYSYTIEINTAKEKGKDYKMVDRGDGNFEPEPIEPEFDYEEVLDEEGNVIDMRPVLTERGKKQIADMEDTKPTQYHSNLTVPGGTNYTENEIATPAITPSIKGHAQFATDKGIGWFRSDEQISKHEDKFSWAIEQETGEKLGSKTRRILEVQSDLFQKGRDKGLLTGFDFKLKGAGYRFGSSNQYEIINNHDGIVFFKDANTNKYYKKPESELIELQNKSLKNKPDNQFLQLLNKDNNWVTFFIKSIIQDSAKKGYEKVLFPSGKTVEKIEDFNRITEEIEKFDKEIEWINNQIDEGVIIEKYPYTNKEDKTDKIGIEAVKDLRIQKINKDKQHYLDAQKDTTSTINFYENTVTNILHKQFGKENVKQITDEYDNTWNELSINQARDLSNVLLQKNRKGQIVGQAQFDPNARFMAGKVLIDYINGTVDTVPHEYAHLYIAWFRNTPLVQEAIKQWGSEEALVQAIGEQAVVQRGKAWTWWKKFVAWLLNSANELSDLSRENLRDILTDAFLSRQDITATLDGDVYKKDRTSGEWIGVDPDNTIVYPSDAVFKAALDAEQADKVKNDAMIKPAWKNNKRAALENRLLDMHKAIALHPVNAQNLLAPVSTAITKGIVKKLGIRAKHATRSAVIDPLSNINASIAMVQGKQGVGIVANAINTKAVLTGVDAKLTPMYPVQSPLSDDKKHTQLPINLRMLGIEKVEYADGTSAYSLGKLVDTFGNSIISNLSESLTQQVDNVKDPVAVELGYTLKTLGLTSYILTLGVPQEVLAGLTAKGGVVTAWNNRVEENENLFHKGVTEESFEVSEYTGESRKISTRFEESNSTLKVEFINSLLKKQPVPSKYIEVVVDNKGRPKGHILKHEALDTDNVSLDSYDAVKLLFYWELIDQARAYGNTIKALTADTKTHKSIDAAAEQQLLINQQLQGVESIVDKDDIAKVISSRAALKSNTKSVISPFFNMQRKYGEYFSKYFYTHENGISSYLAASLKARYKLYSGDKLNRLISTAHNDFMIYLMTRMTAVNPNTTSSLAKFNNANAPLVGVDALLKHGEGLKMSAVNSIYNNLTLISKQPNITTSRAYYYAQPATVRNNNTTALYQNVTPEMARSLLDIFRFELGRVIKADVNIDNNVSIYLQNIPSIDLIMFKDSAITTSAANNYIEIFEELRTLSPGLVQLFNSISLFQAGLNNSPYNLFKTLPITDLLAEDKSKSLVSNLATTVKTFDKLLPKKGAEADKRSAAIYDMVDDFLRWFDLQYGKIYVQPEAASKYNKASMLYRKFDPTQQKFLIYVKPEAGGDGNPLASVSSLTKNYLSAVPYAYAPTTTAETNSNVITNATINEDATVAQLKTLGSLGDIIKSYVDAGGEIETLCS